ncbi:hypothetical protein N0O92_11885 [Alkalihalobacillus sp. MEB130]|uniref:hypothetical protein n=1 Tax=Alkalihalobacillus sp. MEB130 TaxID=2976704 RepID=UPI0028DE7379|nr:hypothetical protein [Alkalihalobacillus sp. MEB130]MDT8860932.1 hypothetical protein [Alkalihalobacillus sp. MEB130]
MEEKNIHTYFEERVMQAKTQFERTVDCKHTEFDDLYPYMTEQPQFFWYKRYVAWQELLTVIKIAEDLDVEWKSLFLDKQSSFIEGRVLDAKVLDDWFEESEKHEKESSKNE